MPYEPDEEPGHLAALPGVGETHAGRIGRVSAWPALTTHPVMVRRSTARPGLLLVVLRRVDWHDGAGLDFEAEFELGGVPLASSTRPMARGRWRWLAR